ncbi:hypothetical protein B9Z19DRAFT_937379, partial [Tuber borchii]
QSLINFHRTFLHKHLCSSLLLQHLSASPDLRRLADKHAMPARVWRPEMYSF